ncbi:predicted protein [Methanosarcina acetivorans C2A]|uniref:Uncharacterized protein n=1 Tax=Methanosarcina acetivorans (strain ATCC 35395 / DSM 2834 / JCM 12185 / C2A) TaxID=188937 RepID=Q8TL95_METAC|nr:predicted protein [Methanosarcina acetivorans C2A]
MVSNLHNHIHYTESFLSRSTQESGLSCENEEKYRIKTQNKVGKLARTAVITNKMELLYLKNNLSKSPLSQVSSVFFCLPLRLRFGNGRQKSWRGCLIFPRNSNTVSGVNKNISPTGNWLQYFVAQ